MNSQYSSLAPSKIVKLTCIFSRQVWTAKLDCIHQLDDLHFTNARHLEAVIAQRIFVRSNDAAFINDDCAQKENYN